jgi:light-regulated signal transduction histidine kinase (bacteriophytochrome)
MRKKVCQAHKKRKNPTAATGKTGLVKSLEYLPLITRDIQNILTVVTGMAEFSDDSRVSTRQRQLYAAFIKIEIQRISQAITGINDTGNLISESARYSFSPIQIDKLFEAIADQWWETSGVTLNVKMPLQLPRIMADKERLFTAFIMLLGNLGANESSKTIIAELSPCEDNVGLRLFWNNGTGYHAANIPKQSSTIRNLLHVNSAGFSALGFSYAQFIIEAHHGKVWCTPDSSNTVSFFVLLPMGNGLCNQERI